MRKTLAAKITLAILLGGVALAPPAQAILVFDAANFGRNAQTAISTAQQVLKQVQQYQTQLLQYQNMLKNTVAPAAYIWSAAQSAITGLRTSIDQLEALKNNAGGLNNLLSQYKNTTYYRSSPCFAATGCTDAQRAALRSDQDAKRAVLMATNESVLRGIDAQQSTLSSDAARLEAIQGNATTAQGQLEALGYANQLAGNSTNQLIQIRGLLLAQQAAGAAQAQAQADFQAIQAAATESARRSEYNASATGTYQWTPPS